MVSPKEINEFVIQTVEVSFGRMFLTEWKIDIFVHLSVFMLFCDTCNKDDEKCSHNFSWKIYLFLYIKYTQKI